MFVSLSELDLIESLTIKLKENWPTFEKLIEAK